MSIDWLKETGDRAKTVAFRVTDSEVQRIEDIRKALRMRSKGEVMRLALNMLDGTMDLAQVLPPSEDEQVKILASLGTFIASEGQQKRPLAEFLDRYECKVEELLPGLADARSGVPREDAGEPEQSPTGEG